jgi:hypothetical protein
MLKQSYYCIDNLEIANMAKSRAEYTWAESNDPICYISNTIITDYLPLLRPCFQKAKLTYLLILSHQKPSKTV